MTITPNAMTEAPGLVVPSAPSSRFDGGVSGSSPHIDIGCGPAVVAADTSVDEFTKRASSAVVAVRTPHAERLRTLLAGPDVEVTITARSRLEVRGLLSDAIGELHVSAVRVARSEWLKLRTLRSSWLTFAIALVSVPGIGIAIAWSTVNDWDHLRPRQQQRFDPLADPLSGFDVGRSDQQVAPQQRRSGTARRARRQHRHALAVERRPCLRRVGRRIAGDRRRVAPPPRRVTT